MLNPGETFQLEGESYIVVHIPEWMCKSALIKEHIDKHDVFAVELRTGNFRMFSNVFISMLKAACVYPTEPEKTTTDSVLKTVEECRAKLRQISSEIKALKGNKL